MFKIVILPILSSWVLLINIALASDTEETTLKNNPTNSFNVLIVEDAALTQKIVTKLVTNTFEEVTRTEDHLVLNITCVETGETGLKILEDSFADEKKKPDVVIFDHNLAGEMKGYDLARRARKMSSDHSTSTLLILNSDDESAITQFDKDSEEKIYTFDASTKKNSKTLKKELTQKLADALLRKNSK